MCMRIAYKSVSFVNSNINYLGIYTRFSEICSISNNFTYFEWIFICICIRNECHVNNHTHVWLLMACDVHPCLSYGILRNGRIVCSVCVFVSFAHWTPISAQTRRYLFGSIWKISLASHAECFCSTHFKYKCTNYTHTNTQLNETVLNVAHM